jgi:hypothetical protein
MIKVILVGAMLAMGCGGSPSSSGVDAGDAGATAVLHSAYDCTAAPGVDAAACVADFRTGSGSDCVYTCDNGVCSLVRVVDGGYQSVATCVAPY